MLDFAIIFAAFLNIIVGIIGINYSRTTELPGWICLTLGVAALMVVAIIKLGN